MTFSFLNSLMTFLLLMVLTLRQDDPTNCCLWPKLKPTDNQCWQLCWEKRVKKLRQALWRFDLRLTITWWALVKKAHQTWLTIFGCAWFRYFHCCRKTFNVWLIRESIKEKQVLMMWNKWPVCSCGLLMDTDLQRPMTSSFAHQATTIKHQRNKLGHC